ncbi:hypothetical protein [Synechococcus sp. CCY 0621]|uniref:hypothetical protein n=1 Tax=Synechococcus sp. CCY 0621 TaxID=2815603 RepID=UPI001C22112E|nr:hypothetical protein [Synechococcus sp. CCY 0621]
MAHFLQKDAANGLACGERQPVGIDGNPLTPFRVKGDVSALGPCEFQAATQFNQQAEARPAQPLTEFDDAISETRGVGASGTKDLAQQAFIITPKGEMIELLIQPRNSRVPKALNSLCQGEGKIFLNVKMSKFGQRIRSLLVLLSFHVTHQKIDPADVVIVRIASPHCSKLT